MRRGARGFLPRQFSNPDNPGAHRSRTAHEIIAQIPGGCVDAVVSGVGTGGTLVGLYQGFSDFGWRGEGNWDATSIDADPPFWGKETGTQLVLTLGKETGRKLVGRKLGRN